MPGFSPVCFAANGAGKEQAAPGEEHGEEGVKLLQGQEEEERLRGARGAEDEGQRGVSTQVGQESGCCRVHCLAAGTAYGTFRVCHLQVEKGKDLELKEKFDALKREHEETLQGEIPGQSTTSTRSPQPFQLVWGCGTWGCHRWCPCASDTQLLFPLQSSKECTSRRSCCWQSPTTGPRKPYRYPWGDPQP